MKTAREWATPLVIGSFILVAVTGILMFFHSASRLGRELHEWLGWALVIGGCIHAYNHRTAIKHYLTTKAGIIVSVFVALGLVAVMVG